jgi:mono/diheme cytochrome c family protein
MVVLHALPLAASPVVTGFDRFGADASGTGVSPGLLLYNELKCAVCHGDLSPAQSAFPTHKAPILDKVGARVRLDYLREFIAHPQQMKPGTMMPDVMADWGDGKRYEAADALAHFLASQGGPVVDVTKAPARDAYKKGDDLFHSVGCVACHEPVRKAQAAGAEDDFWDDSVETPEIALPSVPLPNFYDKTSPDALARFLFDPAAVRPGGRMPNMTLTEEEARQIAHWLIDSDKAEGVPPAKNPAIDPARVTRGKELFQTLGCASCHELSGTTSSLAAPKLAGLDLAAKGCLAETAQKDIPWFDLNDAQRTALIAARGTSEATKPTKTDLINHSLLALNCYACHERNGLGGPEPGRGAYFAETEVLDLGDEGRLPPTLTGVGSKLTPTWLNAILTDGGRVRPYMATRMPHFGAANVAPLVEALLEVDKEPNPPAINITGLEHHHRNRYGRELMGTEGLGCITCHKLDSNKSLGIPAVDLAFVPKRLQPTWFMRYMLDPNSLRPGTRMPGFFLEGKSQGSELFGSNSVKQIEALWIYLREVKETRLPIGMEKTDDYELRPVDHPLIHRTFIKNVGTHAIAVGFPEGIHFAYDALGIRPAAVWRGGFIDAEAAQADRFTPFVKPLGESIAMLPAGVLLSPNLEGPWSNDALRFTGYRLDASRTPIFGYRLGNVTVEESLRPTEDGKAFQRRLVFTGPSQTVFLRLGKGEQTGNPTAYHIGDVEVEITAGPPAQVGPEDVGWVLPIEVTEAGTSIEQVISW